MYVYLPKFNEKMHYYDTYRSTIGIFVTVNIHYFRTKDDANLETMPSKFYFINLSIHQDPKNNWSGPFKYIFLRASRLSRSASIRVHVEVLNGLTSNNNNSQ